MFFGKYLIENGVVTSEQIVDAITVQMESIPSIIRVVREKNMLNCSEIVELVDKSINERKTIMDIIAEKSIFAKDEMKQILEDRYSSGKGLGEILFQQGHISSLMISEYVKKYFKYQSSFDAFSKEDGEDNFEGILSFDIGGEFVKIFDRELCKFINQEIEKIKNKDRKRHVFNIRKELALLVTLASMGSFEYTIELLQNWLEVLDQSKEIDERCHWNEVASGLKCMMDLTWGLREQIVKEGGEKNLLENSVWKRKYHDGIRRAEYLLQEYHYKKSV